MKRTSGDKFSIKKETTSTPTPFLFRWFGAGSTAMVQNLYIITILYLYIISNLKNYYNCLVHAWHSNGGVWCKIYDVDDILLLVLLRTSYWLTFSWEIDLNCLSNWKWILTMFPSFWNQMKSVRLQIFFF